jgi:hypothetical protein
VLDRDGVPEVAEQLVHPPKVVQEEPITVAWHRHDLHGSDHRLDADTLRGRVDQVRGLCATVGDANVDAVQLEWQLWLGDRCLQGDDVARSYDRRGRRGACEATIDGDANGADRDASWHLRIPQRRR